MRFFTTKKEVKLEDFCRDFYENITFYPRTDKVVDMEAYAEIIKGMAIQVDSKFTDVDIQKFADELTALRFELLALAFTHKFVSNKIIIAQSIFTKHYLKEKVKSDIWDVMGSYNRTINSATLDWLAGLGKVNLPYNHRMMNSLCEENANLIKEMRINTDEMDDFLKKVNNRTWSENSWRYKFILSYLQINLYKNLNINPETLNDAVLAHIATTIKCFYDEAKKSLAKVKIND